MDLLNGAVFQGQFNFRGTAISLSAAGVHTVRIGEFAGFLRHCGNCSCRRLCFRCGNWCGFCRHFSGCRICQCIPHRFDQAGGTIRCTGNCVHIGALGNNDILQQCTGILQIGAVIFGRKHLNIRDLPAGNCDLHCHLSAKAGTRTGIHAVPIGCRFCYSFYCGSIFAGLVLALGSRQNRQSTVRGTATASLLQRVPHGRDQPYRTISCTGNGIHICALQGNDLLEQCRSILQIGRIVCGADNGNILDLSALDNHLHRDRSGKSGAGTGIGAVPIGTGFRNRCDCRSRCFCRYRNSFSFLSLFRCQSAGLCSGFRTGCVQRQHRCRIIPQRNRNTYRQNRCRQKAQNRQNFLGILPFFHLVSAS